jgi:hypothetical protein
VLCRTLLANDSAGRDYNHGKFVPSNRRYIMSSTFRSTRSLVTFVVAAVGWGTIAAIPAAQQGQVVTTPSGQQLRVEPVATNLDTIWDMVWAPVRPEAVYNAPQEHSR